MRCGEGEGGKGAAGPASRVRHPVKGHPAEHVLELPAERPRQLALHLVVLLHLQVLHHRAGGQLGQPGGRPPQLVPRDVVVPALAVRAVERVQRAPVEAGRVEGPAGRRVAAAAAALLGVPAQRGPRPRGQVQAVQVLQRHQALVEPAPHVEGVPHGVVLARVRRAALGERRPGHRQLRPHHSSQVQAESVDLLRGGQVAPAAHNVQLVLDQKGLVLVPSTGGFSCSF
eukprot:CAMPEP_0194585770 /NCGR_PEP_ID=MMETSP0292-20121207/17974_1 /TAXON_ID=39354 /ORGANISM="Heterosigma akashiwo, Strain CCMP2393" /LENGTH=227 /DNA_ID=CAMNT_0039441329 /DNA_START=349 /DNA_END=1032 /DNA_ORIENTATION=+